MHTSSDEHNRPKRISNGMIPHLIDIFLSFTGVPCVKIIIYLLTTMHSNIRGVRKWFSAATNPFFRNAMLQFHTDTILICMHTPNPFCCSLSNLAVHPECFLRHPEILPGLSRHFSVSANHDNIFRHMKFLKANSHIWIYPLYQKVFYHK